MLYRNIKLKWLSGYKWLYQIFKKNNVKNK